MRNVIKVLALVLAAGFAGACASQKVPAEAALQAAESAWAAVSAEATKYVPDQAKGVEDAVAAAKDAMTKGDYEAVIKSAGAIPAQVAEVTKAVAAKKDEWTTAWRTLDSTLGGGLTAVQTKVDELAAAKKLPKGVEKTAVEGAKAALAAAQQTYADAKIAFQGGDYEGALAKANEVRSAVAKIVTDLKLEMPVLAESGKALAESATKAIEGGIKK